MATKREERDNPNSCWNKAADDEILFVLRSKDPEMPNTIRDWAARRINKGINEATDPKIVEALIVARAVSRLHSEPTSLERPSTVNMTTAESLEKDAWRLTPLINAPLADIAAELRRRGCVFKINTPSRVGTNNDPAGEFGSPGPFKPIVLDPKPAVDARAVLREETMLSAEQADAINQTPGHPAQIPMAGGRAASSKMPRWELIPTVALDAIAERFELGIVRKAELAWNALSGNQECLTDRDFIINRLAHTMRHCALLRDRILRNDFIGDDDASAIAWGGVFAVLAVAAIKGMWQPAETNMFAKLNEIAKRAQPALERLIDDAMSDIEVTRVKTCPGCHLALYNEAAEDGICVDCQRASQAAQDLRPSEPLRPGDRNYVDPRDAIGTPVPGQFCKQCGGNHESDACPVSMKV